MSKKETSEKKLPSIWAVMLEGKRRLEIEGDVSLLRMLSTIVSSIDVDDVDAAESAAANFDPQALSGKEVYVVVGKEMVPSRDAFVSSASIVAICSTKDEAQRRLAEAPHLPGDANHFVIQVWQIDGKRVS